MKYHYRFLADGSCDILCTRCFQKVGMGQGLEDARRQADLHICPAERPAATADLANGRARSAAGIAMPGYSGLSVPTAYLLLAVVTFFYVLPTLVEMGVMHRESLWAVGILAGDLSGCVGIFFALRKRKLAVILYLALTAIECALYSTQILSEHLLVYLMDIVPTVILASAILRPRGGLRDGRTQRGLGGA